MLDRSTAPLSAHATSIAALLEPATRVPRPERAPRARRPDRAIALHVLRFELAANLRTAIAWLVPLGLLVALVCVLQPTFAAGPLAAKLASLPQVMRDALGLAVVDFHRPAAYLATNFTYIAVGTALFGAVLGARIVAREEARHTAELLYAAPARRSAILAGKAAALALYVVALPCALAIIAMSLLAAIVPAPLEPGLVASLFAGAAVASLLFAGAGMLIATLRPRAAGSLALALVLATFVVGMFSSAVPALHPLRYVSPHKLVEATGIVTAGALDPGVAIAFVALGLAGVGGAIARYRGRDIHA